MCILSCITLNIEQLINIIISIMTSNLTPSTTLPFLRLSWFSPPDWKSYKATNSCGSSSSWARRFSFDVHLLAVSSDIGVEGAPDPDEPDKVPIPPEPRVLVLRVPGGSVSGRLGMCGSGRFWRRASVIKKKVVYQWGKKLVIVTLHPRPIKTQHRYGKNIIGVLLRLGKRDYDNIQEIVAK